MIRLGSARRALAALLLGTMAAAGPRGAHAQNCRCPDGAAPTFGTGTPPCANGPPQGSDCPAPPAEGGGDNSGVVGVMPPPPQGGMTGGPNMAAPPPPCTGTPCWASLLGDVGLTTVAGTDARSGDAFPVGENIYGPFEAGFTVAQNNILQSLGCSGDGSAGHVPGGIDTKSAEQMIAAQCSITLPRCSSAGCVWVNHVNDNPGQRTCECVDPADACRRNGNCPDEPACDPANAAGAGTARPCPTGDTYISLLDECGGHTTEYHFHERMSCLYDATIPGVHSPRVGTALDGKGIYGKWEIQSTDPSNRRTGTLPVLDA